MHRIYLYGESGDAFQFGISHGWSQFPNFLSSYKPNHVYNMDEMGFFYKAQTTKTFHKER
jgi:hypothetical protein